LKNSDFVLQIFSNYSIRIATVKNLFGAAFILGVFTAIRAGLGVFAIVCALSTGVGWAQDAPSEEPAVEAPQDMATAYPAGLDDPSIDLKELQLRLIPLTADQLGALAAAWQEQARSAAQATVDKSLEIRAAEGTRRRPCVRSGWRF
jgi:small conductance mechanosensitive channel